MKDKISLPDESLVLLCSCCGEIHLSLEERSCQSCRHSLLDNGKRLSVLEAEKIKEGIRQKEEKIKLIEKRREHCSNAKEDFSALFSIDGTIENLEIYSPKEMLENKGGEMLGVMFVLAILTIGAVPLFYYLFRAASPGRGRPGLPRVFFTVSGHYMVGSFSSWAWKEGEFVRVTASRKGDNKDLPSRVHAILEPSTGILALPDTGGTASGPGVKKGKKDFFIFILFFGSLFTLIGTVFSLAEYGLSFESLKMLAFFLLLVFPVLILFYAALLFSCYWSGREFEKIMQAMGFSDVENIDMSSVAVDSDENSFFLYRRVIKDDPFPVEGSDYFNKWKIQALDNFYFSKSKL